MQKKATRRFVQLDTEEVSLVDNPANEVTFLVTKNQEMIDMSQKNDAKEDTRVSLDVDGAENSAVAKAIGHVNEIVERIAAIAKSKSEEKDEATDSKEDVSKAAIPSNAKEDAKSDDKEEDIEEEKKECKKSQDISVDENNLPLTMQNLVEAVNKAAAFTPSRIEQLQSAYETLKLVLESVAPNASPKNLAPVVEKHPNPSPVSELTRKSVDGNKEFLDVLKSLSEQLEKIDNRVSSIEKARNASNSVDDEGITDTQKAKQSMWTGVL